MSNTQDLIQQANNRMVDVIQENKQLKKRIAELEIKQEVEIKNAIKSSLRLFGEASLSTSAIDVLANKYIANLKTKGGAE